MKWMAPEWDRVEEEMLMEPRETSPQSPSIPGVPINPSETVVSRRTEMKGVSRLIVLAAGVYVGLCAPLLASRICVTVNDEADLFLDGAFVRIVNLTDPDFAVSVVTDGEGKACSDDLPAGMYYVDAGMGGFLNVRYYPVASTVPKTSA